MCDHSYKKLTTKNREQQEHVIYTPIVNGLHRNRSWGDTTHEQALSVWQGPCVILPSKPFSRITCPGQIISSHTALRAALLAVPKDSG